MEPHGIGTRVQERLMVQGESVPAPAGTAQTSVGREGLITGELRAQRGSGRGLGKREVKERWPRELPAKRIQEQSRPVSQLYLRWIHVCRTGFPGKFSLVSKKNTRGDTAFCPVVCPPGNVIAGVWTQADSSFLHLRDSFGMGKNVCKDLGAVGGEMPEEQLGFWLISLMDSLRGWDCARIKVWNAELPCLWSSLFHSIAREWGSWAC